jgi:hypothetical protein
MDVAVIGFSQTGRSTLYRAAAQGKAKGEMTAVPVPDERFDKIVEQVKPKKATPATVILQDNLEPIQGGEGGKMFSQRFIDKARKADLLLHVVRAFDNPMAPYHEEVDPVRDQEAVDVELVLADLQIVEGRIERLGKTQEARKPGSSEYVEYEFLKRIKEPLEEGKPMREMEMAEEEAKIARNFQFLSAKQCVVAFNVDEERAAEPPESVKAKMDELNASGTPAFAVCATIEEEIAQLDPADQPEFLESLGLEKPAADVVIQAVYQGLGLITFFTAGENETRAWPLREGSNSVKAAETIHTDIAKGFIRAEVVHYEDYVEAGSLDAAYKGGKMHLEGKEYVVQDGDLLHIRTSR